MPDLTDKSLESWIWDAACSIRGAKDAPKYKEFILPLIFTKRLCDVFDDEINRIAQEVGSRAKTFKLVKHDKKLVRFFLPLEPKNPDDAVWSIIRTLSDRIGEQLTTYLRAIADANPLLKGIIDRIDFNAIVKDLGLLKHLFKAKLETKAPAYLALVRQNFNDKDVDNVIEHFRDKERRKEFFKEYKEIEMLYEIISPDAFLRPFIENYVTLSGIYEVARNAYTRRVYVDRAFQKKTNELVQRHIGAAVHDRMPEYVTLNADTIETIKNRQEGEATKIINLVKAIERTAEEHSDDPFLVALSERAKAVQESFEDRQTSTADALAELLKEIEKNEQRKKEQADKGLDGLTYFVLCKLTDDGIPNPEQVSKKVREGFAKFPNWQRSEAALREVRKHVTFAIYAEEDDMAKVTATVDALFILLQKSFRP